MSFGTSLDVKEQVRQASDIVEVVGRYLPLSQRGRLYLGLCPWHDDSRPSLQVNPDRQTWKCWVCDEGGDVFSFVMRREGVEFREALQLLADQAGIPLGQPGSDKSGGLGDRRLMFRVLAWAEEQYHRFLSEAADAQDARAYLAGRRIQEESLRRFRVGFSPPSWDWLLKRSRDTEFQPELLERVGLVVPRKDGSGFYDRFRGRVLFPIHDAQGRTIAFGGRALPGDASSEAKYINSPETPLFAKSGQLYALDLARDAARRCGNILVMEGYTDVVMAHQYGLDHAVAVLGTALTERHIPLLRRVTDSITLVLDGDEAGKRRASEVLALFIAHQVDLKILTLPQNLDPCDFIVTHGGDAFRALAAQAADAIDHKIRTVTKGMVTSSDTHRANMALEEILSTMAGAPSPAGSASSELLLREQQVLARLARRFDVPEPQLRTRLAELRRQRRETSRTTPEADTAVRPDPSLDPWDRELLQLALLAPEAWETIRDRIALDDLRSPLGQTLFERCLDLEEEGHPPTLPRLRLLCEDHALSALLVQLEDEGHAKSGGDLSRRLDDLLASAERRHRDAEVHADLRSLRRGELDTQQEKEVLAHLVAKLAQGDAPPPPEEDGPTAELAGDPQR